MIPVPLNLVLRLFPALLALLLGAGCAGYRLGPSNGQSAGARSIEVKPFIDRTFEPRLLEPVASALRKSIQRDGTFRLATSNPGDVVVSGTLTQYLREPLTLQPNDVFSTRDYEVRLTAHIVAIDRSSGQTLIDRDVIARTTIRSVPDLNSAERQAAPLIADDLARIVTALLVDGNW
jgi:hypothetical protein